MCLLTFYAFHPGTVPSKRSVNTGGLIQRGSDSSNSLLEQIALRPDFLMALSPLRTWSHLVDFRQNVDAGAQSLDLLV